MKLSSHQNIFSVPGYRVCLANRDQFGGGVVLFVKYDVRHDQFLLPNVVINFETIVICLYLQNNNRLLFVLELTRLPYSALWTLFFFLFKLVRGAILLFVLEHAPCTDFAINLFLKKVKTALNPDAVKEVCELTARDHRNVPQSDGRFTVHSLGDNASELITWFWYGVCAKKPSRMSVRSTIQIYKTYSPFSSCTVTGHKSWMCSVWRWNKVSVNGDQNHQRGPESFACKRRGSKWCLSLALINSVWSTKHICLKRNR